MVGERVINYWYCASGGIFDMAGDSDGNNGSFDDGREKIRCAGRE